MDKMDKQAQTVPVHLLALGKGECLAHKAPQRLPQGVVPTLHMIALAALLTNR
jgi:hypothetical protein